MTTLLMVIGAVVVAVGMFVLLALIVGEARGDLL